MAGRGGRRSGSGSRAPIAGARRAGGVAVGAGRVRRGAAGAGPPIDACRVGTSRAGGGAIAEEGVRRSGGPGAEPGGGTVQAWAWAREPGQGTGREDPPRPPSEEPSSPLRADGRTRRRQNRRARSGKAVEPAPGRRSGACREGRRARVGTGVGPRTERGTPVSDRSGSGHAAGGPGGMVPGPPVVDDWSSARRARRTPDGGRRRPAGAVWGSRAVSPRWAVGRPSRRADGPVRAVSRS